MRHLQRTLSDGQGEKGWNVLFGVVRGICEEAGEYSANDPVATLVQEPIDVGVHEIVIEKREPYLLHEFVLEECKYGRGRRYLLCIMICLEDRAGELRQDQSAFRKVRRGVLTVGTYARWWAANAAGLKRTYLVKLAKKM